LHKALIASLRFVEVLIVRLHDGIAALDNHGISVRDFLFQARKGFGAGYDRRRCRGISGGSFGHFKSFGVQG
jgi:hypothetical protein